MPTDPLTDKLVKAHANILRLCRFFAARSHWRPADDALPSARELVRAAETVDRTLRTMLIAANVEPSTPDPPRVDPAGDGVFDRERLDRFAVFLTDLDAWFSALAGPPTGADGVATLRELEAALAGILVQLNELTGVAGTAQPAAEAEPDVAAAAAPEATPAETSPPAVATPPAPADQPTQLVLEDSDALPMVQSFHGIKELTPACVEMVDGFLAAWDIEYTDVKRKKLLQRLVRWIDAAPHGQVLVIKMKTLDEPFEPYPSYVSRELVTGPQPIAEG